MFKRQFLEPFANLVNYVFVPVNRPLLPLCLAHPRPERGRITHTNHTDKCTHELHIVWGLGLENWELADGGRNVEQQH